MTSMFDLTTEVEAWVDCAPHPFLKEPLNDVTITLRGLPRPLLTQEEGGREGEKGRAFQKVRASPSKRCEFCPSCKREGEGEGEGKGGGGFAAMRWRVPKLGTRIRLRCLVREAKGEGEGVCGASTLVAEASFRGQGTISGAKVAGDVEYCAAFEAGRYYATPEYAIPPLPEQIP